MWRDDRAGMERRGSKGTTDDDPKIRLERTGDSSQGWEGAASPAHQATGDSLRGTSAPEKFSRARSGRRDASDSANGADSR